MNPPRTKNTPAPFPRKDRDGEPLRVGDVVRVVGVPPLPGLEDEDDELCTRVVFEHLVGTYHQIVDFDEFGCAEILVDLHKEPLRGIHVVWYEPYLLLKRRTRAERAREKKVAKKRSSKPER